MAQIIITPDDSIYNANSPTFLVYGSKCKDLLYTRPKQTELNSEELSGQGRPTFRPFGIASDAQFLYVVSHNKLGVFDKNNFEFCRLLDIPLFINTHEITAHSGVLYIANTANDTIGIYNIKERSYKVFSVNTFEVTDAGITPNDVNSHDALHVNSLCYHEGYIYFCLHNLNKRSSQLGRFNISTHQAEIISNAGYCAHGVQVLNDKLYSLSTGTGEVVEVDLNTRNVALYKVVDSAKTFLRGLDILDGGLIFGGSNMYSEERTVYMNNCFVAQFDLVTKKSKVILNVKDAYIISDMKVLN